MAVSHDTGTFAVERPFTFLHIGDLHLTQLSKNSPVALKKREQRLQQDLKEIFSDISSIDPLHGYDFVYLPGDLAENACRAEYDVLRLLLEKHPDLRVRLIPGDHDRARGDLDEFERFRSALVGAQSHCPPVLNQKMEIPNTVCPHPGKLFTCNTLTQYYFAETHNGVRCIFLDLVSASQTKKVWGLDFRLGISQYEWLANQIMEARAADQPCAVFMHCYPGDMREPDDARAVAGLFWDGGVRLVEMGHTHYNEIAHDGRTLYATARSIGQNEDGPTGYAVVALDHGVTSWRYKQLQQTWPFVLITSPSDRRLATEALDDGGRQRISVRAVVLSDQPVAKLECQCRVDDGAWRPMNPAGGNLFEARVDWRPGSKKVSVKATDGRWSTGPDFMDIDTVEPAAPDFEPPTLPKCLGTGVLSVGPWVKKGVRGDRLGPNSGGRKW